MRRPAPESPPLLFHVGRSGDPHRAAVAFSLAAIAQRAGHGFDAYVGDLRRGRHFGGGPLDAVKQGVAAGSTAAGGAHAEQLLWLGTAWSVLAVGDPGSWTWPVLEAAGAEILCRSEDPCEIYETVLRRLDAECPSHAVVLDDRPQGPLGLRTAPYLFPTVLADRPVLALGASADAGLRTRLERLGVRRLEALMVDRERVEAFPGGLEVGIQSPPATATYASMTSSLAVRHREWGRGVLLGDPDLVLAQLPRARRLRLLPLYGQPQTEVIAAAHDIVTAAGQPVFGRQYDDHDFDELSRRGRAFQLVDPTPPFDSARAVRPRWPDAPLDDEDPSDEQLSTWAREGRILATALLWCGMVRELDCVAPLVDLVADTGLRAGLVLTAEAIEQVPGPPLSLLLTPSARGGAHGQLELLLASAGHGVAFEAMLPDGGLRSSLVSAVRTVSERLPPPLRPAGWWPLLDTELVARRARPIELSGRRPVLRLPPRTTSSGAPPAVASDGPRAVPRDVRRLAGTLARRARLETFVEQRRPFDDRRPGALSPAVAAAVRDAGFSYMWTKSNFGTPRVAFRDGDFVALPFTAGNWDGWTPFYTLAHPLDVDRAERRLLRHGGPGWLAGTIDAPLWALPGELIEHGWRLHAIADRLATGGRSGRLVNVTPRVVARYARLLEDTPSLGP